MAFPVEWPADIWLQLVICAGLVAATVVLARIDFLRFVIVFIGSAILQATRLAAAGVIWLFDKVMPVDGRNGRLPRANFAVWVLLNVTAVAAWIIAGEVAAASPYAIAAAVAAATFTVLNLLLLGASYWAVRETVEVTNGDLAAKEARFAEASPARNVAFVLGTAILLVMQIAVVVDWVQQVRAIALVTTDGAIGPRYLNFLLATVDSLPLAAFYGRRFHPDRIISGRVVRRRRHPRLAAAARDRKQRRLGHATVAAGNHPGSANTPATAVPIANGLSAANSDA